MIRRVLFSLFAFAVLFSLQADEPSYYSVEAPGSFYYTYFYPPIPSDGLFSGFVDFYGDGSLYADDDWGTTAYKIPPSEYFPDANTSYVPYNSDPAYASPVPSGPPVGGGGGSGSGGGSSGGGGGGDDAVGFDPSSALGGMSDLASGLAVGVGSLVLACVGIVSCFLVYRKFVVSAKRV